jgi:hypothetical protein
MPTSFLIPPSSFLIPPSSPLVLLTQRPKDNLLVYPVDELGPEPRLDLAQKCGKCPSRLEPQLCRAAPNPVAALGLSQ